MVISAGKLTVVVDFLGSGWTSYRTSNPRSVSDSDQGKAFSALRLYGRRKGKRLRGGRRALLDTNLEQVRIAPETLGMQCDPGTLFSSPMDEVWLEIGFGGGEHLAAQAKSHPRIGFIGAEVFENGIASLLHHQKTEKLTNIRVWIDDARALLPLMSAHSLNRVFLMFPDPWPKTRHAKRRFISDETLDELARTLRPGGHLRVATDHPVYAHWCLRHVPTHLAFQWAVSGPGDWRQPPPDAHPTRYERKAIAAGRRPVYLTFVRNPGP